MGFFGPGADHTAAPRFNTALSVLLLLKKRPWSSFYRKSTHGIDNPKEFLPSSPSCIFQLG